MMLSFGEAVRRFYRNYVNPEGRAQRSAYWWVLLYQLIIYAVLLIVLSMADGGPQIFEIINLMLEGNDDPELAENLQLGASGIFALLMMVLFGLLNFIPGIMLQIRRFHDLGQTGWLVLVFFVVGALKPIGILADIAHIIWFTRQGTQGPNKYGPDPLGHNSEIFK